MPDNRSEYKGLEVGTGKAVVFKEKAGAQRLRKSGVSEAGGLAGPRS